jgi:hypothetical protein
MDTRLPRGQEVMSASHPIYEYFISTALHSSGSRHGHGSSVVLAMVSILYPNLPRDSSQVLTGQCILTVGTDNRRIADWGHVKLLPAHCYAVIGPVIRVMC